MASLTGPTRRRQHQRGTLQHAAQQRGRLRQGCGGVVPGLQQASAFCVAGPVYLTQRGPASTASARWSDGSCVRLARRGKLAP
ncbi:hypothetical protein XarjCFBP7645_12650 [Xanthomonas arboricola]|uniref:Uncharacterized protein n=1 Tax=Xanthomonas arboricola TaxID=56448 RepID=A0A2S7AF40_9XANT|nr:hypothetical protein XarjCFBP7645_12650 [Xanthomonas arboricola]